MNRSHIARVVRVTIPVVVLVVVTSVVTLSAQGNPTLTQILTKLDDIIELLVTIPPVPPGPVTLTTSMMTKSPSVQVWCSVANVGTETVEVDIRLLVDDGGERKVNLAVSVAPSETEALVLQPFEAPTFEALRCEFTVHGSASLVRANMLVVNSSGDTIASAEAR